MNEIEKLKEEHMQALTAYEATVQNKDRQIEALAAEGEKMLRLLTDISENHVEYYSEGEGYMFAGVPLDYVSEINSYVSRDVNAENPFTATDAVIADIEARGVERFVNHLQRLLDAGNFDGDEVGVMAGAIHCGTEMVEQLRSGKGAA